MLEIWDIVETILPLTAPPSSTPSFLLKAFITPGGTQMIIKDDFCWIIIKVIEFQNIVWEFISRYNLPKTWACMLYRRMCEYIITYKLMTHKQTLTSLDIDLLTHIYVERIENMVKDFKTYRCMLGFDSLFLELLVK